MPRVIIIPDEGMSDEVKADLKHKFENDQACRWCGGLHHRECPRVKHITYHPSDDRQVREVEFWGDGEWDRSSTVWPEDIV
jgi:hypothetical protein